jgi:multicomponent Na+:H+ antiporter subunit D
MGSPIAMLITPALPVLIPLVTAAATACTGRHRTWQQALSWTGAVAVLIVAIDLVAQASDAPTTLRMGSWPVPMAIELRIDRLSALLVLVTALLGAAVLLCLHSHADPGPCHPSRLPLLHGTLAGVAGAFCTADLFNLYVWFEMMLICALGLLAQGRRPDQLDAAFKYLGLNLFGTLLLLAGIGLVYGATGQLQFDAVGQAAQRLDPALKQALMTLLGLALLLKAAAFPLCAWLPASYHTLPAPVAALLAGLLTKAGVYAVLRLMGDVFAPSTAALSLVLGWVAAGTMLAGVLGAAYHWDLRRILAFHIVSQIGYILLAVALGGLEGHAAAIFYTVHHIVVKANLFLIAGLVCALTGSHDLRRIGGLYAARPGLSLLFAVPALSLVGVPPLSGFWAKLGVLQAALAQGRYVWAALVLVVGVLTMYSMTKVWMEAFWKPHPLGRLPASPGRLGPAWGAISVLAAVTLWIGLDPQPLLAYAHSAAVGLEGGRR